MGPLPNGHSWLINGGDPIYLLTGMILQVIRPEINTNVFLAFALSVLECCHGNLRVPPPMPPPPGNKALLRDY